MTSAQAARHHTLMCRVVQDVTSDIDKYHNAKPRFSNPPSLLPGINDAQTNIHPPAHDLRLGHFNVSHSCAERA